MSGRSLPRREGEAAQRTSGNRFVSSPWRSDRESDKSFSHKSDKKTSYLSVTYGQYSPSQDVVKSSLIDLEVPAGTTGGKQAKAVQPERLSGKTPFGVMRQSGLSYNASQKAREGRGTPVTQRKWYTGTEILDISQSDVLTSAEYEWKQANANVIISGLEEMQNSGSRESMHNLLRSRIMVAEKTMNNGIAKALYADGTGNGGKEIGGLQLLISDTPTTGTVGGIDRASETWWRNQLWSYAAPPVGPVETASASNIQRAMNWAQIATIRGTDKVDMWLADQNYYTFYLESLQTNMRFTNPQLADAGFVNLKFMTSDVVYDNQCPADHMYGCNSDYLHYRPHSNRNFTTDRRKFSINQDAIVIPLLWGGNMTLSNSNLQVVIKA